MGVAVQRTLIGDFVPEKTRKTFRYVGRTAVERPCVGAKDPAVQTDSSPGLTL